MTDAPPPPAPEPEEPDTPDVGEEATPEEAGELVEA